MTEYTITIEGYESGLTTGTVEQVIQEQFPETAVTVSEREAPTDRPRVKSPRSLVEWSVYEKDGSDQDGPLIGHVDAQNRREALKHARRKFGAPIEVERH